MIPIKQLHYEYKVEMDKVDTLSKPNILPHQVDLYLNKGIRKWFKAQYDAMDMIGFETSEKQIQKLANFHIISPQNQAGLIPLDLGDGLYELPLNLLDKELAFITKVRMSAAKANCAPVEMGVTFYATNNVFNFFKEPSWKWKAAYYSVGMSTQDPKEKSLFIYTGTTFFPQEVFVSYLTWPVEVYYGGYNHINTKASYQSPNPPIDSDVDERYLDELVHYAVEQTKMDVGDNEWQLSRNKIELDK